MLRTKTKRGQVVLAKSAKHLHKKVAAQKIRKHEYQMPTKQLHKKVAAQKVKEHGRDLSAARKGQYEAFIRNVTPLKKFQFEFNKSWQFGKDEWIAGRGQIPKEMRDMVYPAAPVTKGRGGVRGSKVKRLR